MTESLLCVFVPASLKKGCLFITNREEKWLKLSQPQQFLAQERTIVEKAYPGDIIGVFDPGIFGIGDSLSDEKMKVQFEDFPVFPPEILPECSQRIL